MLEYSSSYVLQLKQKLSPDACMSRCLASSLLLIELDRSGAKRNKKKEIAKGLMHRTQQKNNNLILFFMLPAYPDFKNKIHKYEVYF